MTTRPISAVQSDMERTFRDAFNKHQPELFAAVTEQRGGNPVELVSSVMAVALSISWDVMKTQMPPGARADHAAITFQQLTGLVAKAIVETDLNHGRPPVQN